MVSTSSGSDFRVEPNPVVDGQDATVTYTGSEDTVYFQVDGGETIRVDVSRNKTFKISKTKLRNGTHLYLTTKKGWPGFLMVEIHRRKP